MINLGEWRGKEAAAQKKASKVRRTTKGRPATVKARGWNNDLKGERKEGEPVTENVQGGTMEERLRRIFEDVLAVDATEVGWDVEVQETLGADYLDLVEIAGEIEERLGVTIPDDFDLEHLRTFGDWVRCVLEPPTEESEL